MRRMEGFHLPKSCQPGEYEDKWYRYWMDHQYFAADANSEKTAYCIVIPPPNVTGSLHMGHALNNTLQDILIRWRRMQGMDALWLPGTDHAGISTQHLVEKDLKKKGLTRQDLGREKFEEAVWKWKEKYGGKIIEQLKKLGSSCDWPKERFTLDEGLSRAVRKVFVSLYKEGLIYRGCYIVNWCVGCKTALSDLEVTHQELESHLYYIQYPFVGGEGHITVATTRPETMLGDTAVAVSPHDERFKSMVGKKVILPLMEREIPIIVDEAVDPAFGTGLVKVTPAHDPNDFDIGNRAGLERVQVIALDGKMSRDAGTFAGMDRFEAREAVLKALKEKQLLDKVVPYAHSVGHCYRCNTVVEPTVSTQWFVRIKPLADSAVEAIRDGRIQFIPEHWNKTFYEWMENIHDWCISRQLWWGHRIPAWYCTGCGEVHVEEESPERCTKCGGHLEQDEDVLDTWFSSALWPFSTMGWPEKTRALERYYPASVMVTGFDILFFWVARMVMMGLKFMEDIPFEKVYFHGLVRDQEGDKMSKTRGNTVDPLEIIEEYGTDALRFTLTIMTMPGSDIPLSPERMAGYKAFINKIWNASRFLFFHLDENIRPVATEDLPSLRREHKWILSRVHRLIETVNDSLEAFNFFEAADALYHFMWHEFCDWYIEFIKPILGSGPEKEKAEAKAVATECLDIVLRLLHPIIPFVTEELWEKMPDRETPLIIAPFPASDPAKNFPEAEQEMDCVMDMVRKIRNVRGEMRIDPGVKIELYWSTGNKGKKEIISYHQEQICALVRAERFDHVEALPQKEAGARGFSGDTEFFIPLAGIMDLEKERGRNLKEFQSLEIELNRVRKKLDNEAFLKKAPKEVILKNKSIYKELQGKMDQVKKILSILEEK